MIFILAMDILGRLINKVEQEGLLQAPRLLQHRICIYANDVVLLLGPTPSEINIVMDISQLFDEATVLSIYNHIHIYSLHSFLFMTTTHLQRNT